MSNLNYITGNTVKFRQAVTVCLPYGISLVQKLLDITEIQAKSSEPVARDKANKAYSILKQPLVISDDSTEIPGLSGFPGPYMKDVNEWFTPQDWLNLTARLTDRRIILEQIVIYQDAQGQQLFSVKIPGILLREARGISKFPHATITSFDNGVHSNAEFHEKGLSAAVGHHSAWDEFANWYKEHHS